MTTWSGWRSAHGGVEDFRRSAGRAGDWSALPHGLRGATQALTLSCAYRSGEPAGDVIDELAFDDEATRRRLADAAFAARGLARRSTGPRSPAGGGGARRASGAGARPT